ncbi:MAG TPA: winged helix-turn-helix domain-containing protein [Vicinamibacterales bacterium]|nr:winged helix-turn-helix domain-containing protein [Vicinamibacterales bacterium]
MLPAESVVVPPEPAKVSFGLFVFDRANGLLRDGQREIPLPPRVLGILDLLVARPGTVVPKQELIDTVWKDAFVTDTSLAEAISVLRQALGDDPQSPQYVQTVHRRGYRFVAPITALPTSTESNRQPVFAAPPEPDAPSIGRQFVPWAIASLCLILATVAVWQNTQYRPPTTPVVRMRIEPASGTAFDMRAPALALSPDGRLLAWSGCDSECRLYVRPLDQLDPLTVPGTDGASAPFFSYDGRWIGFFAAGKLQKVAVAGGMPVAITDAAQPFGAAWLPDGHIVFAASERGGLMRVNESGGTAEQLTVPSADAGEVRHCWPAVAPGQRALLFTIARSPHTEAPARIGLMNIGQPSASQTIIENADMARAVSPDYIAFSRGNEIHAVAFDATRQAIAGADQTVINGVAAGQFAVARSGAVVYSIASDPTRPSLTWIPAGAPVSGDLANLQDLTVIPDGSRVAGVSGSDIWVGDVSRGTTTRLTHGGTNVGPVWSGDGTAVYYAAASGGSFEAWRRDSSATQPATRVLSATSSRRHVFPSSISHDGRLLAYTESGGVTRGDVKIVNVASGTSVAAIETPFDEANGVLSPDGRLLAYQSDESGRWEVYVLKLGDRQRVPISSSGGREPRWSPDGSTLFYQDEAAMSVAIDAGGQPMAAPVAVHTLDGREIAGITTGNRVLARRSGEPPSLHAVLTLEWNRDLQRILGPPAARLPR